MSLNSNQARAVAWNEGPALVLAGPGSGKTAVLTLRTARLLEDSANAVLALTFTNKAASEMRERVDKILKQRAERAHLCTFHSFATEILRQHGSHIGLKPDFALLTTEDDRLALLHDAIQAMGPLAGQVPEDRKGVLNLIDTLFSESYTGEPAAPILTSTPAWVPAVFARYCEVLVSGGRLDFGALLHLARQLLSNRPAVVRLLRLTWTHVCVDEFQDTNKAQYDLLRLIVGPGSPNLFVVADDDQIIYQWNGASPDRLSALQKDYPMVVIQLPENYRCPPAIIQLANSLIGHNRSRTPGKQPLIAIRPTEPANVLWTEVFDDADSEAAGVVAAIRARALPTSECVVLARSLRLLSGVAAALQAAGVAMWIAQRKTEFDTAPAMLVNGLLRLANARHDRGALRRVCVAWEQVSGQLLEVEGIAAASTLHGGDFLRAWAEQVAPGITSSALGTWVNSVREALVDRLNFQALIEAFLSTGLPGIDDDLDAQSERRAWRELHDEIVLEHGADNTTLHLYLQELDLRSKAAPAPAGAVRLFTIHGSKGLEFKHVFLVGMAEDQCPSFQAIKKGDASKEMEEERRNCFVAITRVQETLTITRARRYGGWAKTPSRFLAEMGLVGD